MTRRLIRFRRPRRAELRKRADLAVKQFRAGGAGTENRALPRVQDVPVAAGNRPVAELAERRVKRGRRRQVEEPGGPERQPPAAQLVTLRAIRAAAKAWKDRSLHVI
jgi:hypothetical protein